MHLKLKEKKGMNSNRVRFIAKGKFSSTGLMKLKFFQADGDKTNPNLIFETESVEIDFTQSKTGLFNFGVIEFTSE